MNELSKLAVVITRPRAQAEKWQAELQQRGARTFLLPVLTIVPVASPAELQAVKERVLALAEYQKVIFVSQNAVLQAMEWIDRYWPQLPVGVKYFAVGAATARSASACGLQVEMADQSVSVPGSAGGSPAQVEMADQAMNSEALLALPALQAVQGEKILICRGVGGRTYLGDQLRQRGARVDYCELYHRQMPAEAGQQLLPLRDWWDAMASSGREPVFAVHSGESLQNLNQLADDISNALSRDSALHRAILLVPGARVAGLASEFGFRRMVVAVNATDEAMTQALVDMEGG